MGTSRNSTLYGNLHVAPKFQGVDARDLHGRVVRIPFAHTIVSGETGGASAGVQDDVALCVIPARFEVAGLFIAWEALSASAGVGLTGEMGDSSDTDRLLAATDMDAAGSSVALARAGWRYRPTSDTVVLITWKVASPVVGKDLYGYILGVPGA